MDISLQLRLAQVTQRVNTTNKLVEFENLGDSTAQVLRQHLLSPMIPDEETSEGLLRLPIFQQLHRGDRLLVLRGEGGRNLVREHLITQGVRVDYIELYRRQLPAQTASLWQQVAMIDRLPDVVILTSGETVSYTHLTLPTSDLV